MGDSISKIIGIIIAALILFVFPIKNELERQDQISRMFVLTETSKFVDSARNLGYITPIMYEDFTTKLGYTSNMYDVNITHYSKRYDPVYDDPTDISTFKDEFEVNFVGNYNYEIMTALFPQNSLGDNYKMSKGDYFQVKIKNTNKTLLRNIKVTF